MSLSLSGILALLRRSCPKIIACLACNSGPDSLGSHDTSLSMLIVAYTMVIVLLQRLYITNARITSAYSQVASMY